MFSRIGAAFALSMISTCAVALAQVTQRVSVSSSGAQQNADSFNPSISADGRYVAFQSFASNLVPGDTNGTEDVFVRDRATGTTTRVSVDSNGAEANGASFGPAISGDGRYVAFISEASNLVPSDTNGFFDIFVHDLQTGSTERVSVATGGAEGNNQSGQNSGACLSADGRYVAFGSRASNLVPGDSGVWGDIFVRDRTNGTTERVNVSSSGQEANNRTWDASISADGRYVAFASQADNLVAGDTNGHWDIFFRDRQAGTTVRVSVDSTGTQSNADSFKSMLSADGRYVGFESDATNLVAGDTNGAKDVFLHDLQAGVTERVSVDTNGNQGQFSSFAGAMSSDARFVTLWGDRLVAGDTNGRPDVFVRDRQLGTTELVDVSSQGIAADDGATSSAISADGQFVAFQSTATNLVPDQDPDWDADIFVRDRTGGVSFASLCEPGAGGTASCPCSNPPAGPGRGCDNSFATGGAALAASGGAILSSDSLVFTTTGERPTALSIVLQGNAVIPAGISYGQGVRCVAGSRMVRLYSRNSVGGSITAPSFAAGELPVSWRSAASGDVIQPGQSRWYLVYYRDPIVLGGCPAASTFNSTQTGEILWSP